MESAGVTHVVWLLDSELEALGGGAGVGAARLRLIRVCREGEAIGVAGLLLGGKRPVVLLQCTGLFDAGDALRNVVHALGLPLLLVVGVRSWKAHLRGGSTDSCPRFAEPIVQAWQLPHRWLNDADTADNLADAFRQAIAADRPLALLLPE
ncbi:MAG: hypothetical protein U0736_06965 [Gemmataceae bacterium]